MNLLPNTEKEILKKGLKTRFIIMAMFLLAASFLVGFIMLLPSYLLTPGHIFKTIPENLSLEISDNNSVENILNAPAEIDSKLKILQSIVNGTTATDSISKIVGFLPEEVVLNSVIFSRNQGYNEKKGTLIFISGTALDRDSLVSFSSLLKESNLFSAVDMPVSSLTKNKNLPFSMNIFIENK